MLGPVLAVLVATSIALSAAEPSKVDFIVSPQKSRNGDLIFIEEVLASSPKFAPGEKVTVRGRYEVKSVDEAKLCLFLAQSVGSTNQPMSRSQAIEIKKGSGKFELSEQIKHSGAFHVSLYRPDGTAIATVYFGKKAQVEKASRRKLE